MKILYLITKSEAGGAQTHVYQLSKFFSKQGHTVSVMAYPGGWLEEKCKELNISFFPNKFFSNKLNPFSVFRAMNRVKDIVNECKPDIVHCHSSGAGFVGRLAIRNNIPTVFTAHGWGFNVGVPLWQKYIAIFAERLVSKYTRKIIGVSKFVKTLGLKYHIFDNDMCEVVYNGVEIKKSISYEKENNYVDIVCVGRLEEPKQPLLLIKALEHLVDRYNNIRLTIVGEGSQRNTLETYIKKHNITYVSLLGDLPRDHIFDILSKSDIFALISKWEGMPMTILEAMSSKLPVVASDVGGINEIVDEKTGILVKKNTVDEIANALEEFLKDRNKRINIGENACVKITQYFSVEVMCERIEHIYKHILNNTL